MKQNKEKTYTCDSSRLFINSRKWWDVSSGKCQLILTRVRISWKSGSSLIPFVFPRPAQGLTDVRSSTDVSSLDPVITTDHFGSRHRSSGNDIPWKKWPKGISWRKPELFWHLAVLMFGSAWKVGLLGCSQVCLSSLEASFISNQIPELVRTDLSLLCLTCSLNLHYMMLRGDSTLRRNW